MTRPCSLPALLLAALAAGCSAPEPAPPSPAEEAQAEVRFVHGSPGHGVPGPWALAGHRIGRHALRRLERQRGQVWGVRFVHRSPQEVRYTCMVDGLQAATGASLGKLNLALEPASAEELETVVRDEERGLTLRYRLTASFRERFFDTDYADFPAAARELEALSDEELFEVREERAPTSRPASRPAAR